MDQAPFLCALLVGAVAFQNLYAQLGRSLDLAPATDSVIMLLHPLAACAILATIVASASGIDAVTALLLATLGAVVLTVLAVQWLTASRLRSDVTTNRYETRRWLGAAFSFLLIELMAVATTRIDVLIVGVLLGEQATAFYGAAAKTARVVAVSVAAINALMGARISSLAAEGRTEDLERIAVSAARWMTIPAGAFVLFLIAFGKQVLGLFGPAFEDSYPVLVIIALGQLVNAAAGPVAYVLNMSGHQRITVRVVATGMALNMVACLVLVTSVGATGAAIASALTIIGVNLALHAFTRRTIGIGTAIWTRPSPHRPPMTDDQPTGT